MVRFKTCRRFTTRFMIGIFFAMLLLPLANAWPVVGDHQAEDTGSFATVDTIDGKLRGSGVFTKDMGGPWGDGSTTGLWDTVDMSLPSWNFGAATFTIFPEYFIKMGARDDTIGLNIGGTPYPEVDLVAKHEYAIATPFYDTVWYSDAGDKYRDPVFRVKPGSVSAKTKQGSPTAGSFAWFSWYSGSGSQTEDTAGLGAPGDTTWFAFASDSSFGNGAGAYLLMNFLFNFPFDDSQMGDYSMTLKMQTPRAPASLQLGPYVSSGASSAGAVAAFLDIYGSLISGTPSDTSFYHKSWNGNPDANTGGQNIPNTEVTTDENGFTWGESTLPFQWTRSSEASPRFIDSNGNFVLVIYAGIAKAAAAGVTARVQCSGWMDYMAISLSYKDTVNGVVPLSSSLPMDAKLGNLDAKGPWEFDDLFTSGSETWTIGRATSYNDVRILEFKFQLQSITAEYHSHYYRSDRVKGMALRLGGISPPNAIIKPIGNDPFELEVEDLDSYFLHPTGMPPEMAQLRVDLNIGEDDLQEDPYYYEHVIFRLQVIYSEFYAPLAVPFSGGTGDVWFTFPDMNWLLGSFETFQTYDSAYIVKVTCRDVDKFPSPDPAPVFKRFAEATPTNPSRVDLPLWDMVFPFDMTAWLGYSQWLASSSNIPFHLFITLDTSVPAVAPTWPTPDHLPNEIENVGWEQFEAHFVDAQSPVVAAILWWEYTSGGTTHRDSLVMSGASGLALEGDVIGIISPGSPPFETGIEYTFFMEIIDCGGNYAVSSSRAFSIVQETDAPTISDFTISGYPIFAGDELVFGPAAGIPSFQAVVRDEDLVPASVILTVGGSPFAMADLGGGYFGLVFPESGSEWTAWEDDWNTRPSGVYTATISAADTYPHVASVEFTLVKDYVAPECTILPPWEDGDFASGAPVVSLHVLDTVSWVEEVLYSFAPSPAIGDGSWHEAAGYAARKTPLSGDDIAIAIAQEDWDAHVSQGNFRLSFTIRDTGGNYAPVEGINLVRDSITPNMVLIFPAQGLLCNGTPPEFRMLVAGDEPHLDSVGYRVGTGDLRIVLGPGTWSAPDIAWIFTGTLDEGDWTALANETDVVVTFFAMDRASNIDFESRTITVDKEGPRISIISPAPGSVVGGFATSFILDVTEAHPAGLWYSLDNGTTFVPITKLSDTFDQAQWDAAAGAREMRIIFRGRDALGNWGYAEVTVIRSDYAEGGLPWQVGICMAGAAGVLFAINAINKKRMGGR